MEQASLKLFDKGDAAHYFLCSCSCLVPAILTSDENESRFGRFRSSMSLN